jgi:hypothetical protein
MWTRQIRGHGALSRNAPGAARLCRRGSGCQLGDCLDSGFSRGALRRAQRLAKRNPSRKDGVSAPCRVPPGKLLLAPLPHTAWQIERPRQASPRPRSGRAGSLRERSLCRGSKSWTPIHPESRLIPPWNPINSRPVDPGDLRSPAHSAARSRSTSIDPPLPEAPRAERRSSRSMPPARPDSE